MLVLCPNHHAAFDLSTMALHPHTLEVYYLDGGGDVFVKGKLEFREPGHEFDEGCLRYAWEEIWLPALSQHGIDM